jgi:acetyl esterase/lipase
MMHAYLLPCREIFSFSRSADVEVRFRFSLPGARRLSMAWQVRSLVGLWLLLVGLVLPVPARGAPPARTRVLRNLEYVPGGGRANSLDLYRPRPPAGPLPVILYIHGGGWSEGDKAEARGALQQALVARHFALASINHRLSDKARFPAQIHDCKAAVRWLRANARRYGLDPDRIGVWGFSSGAHLAALLGTAGDVPELEGTAGNREFSSRVQAVCAVAGPYDLLRMNANGRSPRDRRWTFRYGAANSPEGILLGGSVRKLRAKARLASPVSHVSPDDPPFLIQHGGRDPLVPVQQARLLYQALKKAGVKATLNIHPRSGHVVRDGKRIGAFFERHLKGKSPRSAAAGSPAGYRAGWRRRSAARADAGWPAPTGHPPLAAGAGGR